MWCNDSAKPLRPDTPALIVMPDIVTLGLGLADITPNTCKLSESGCYMFIWSGAWVKMWDNQIAEIELEIHHSSWHGDFCVG
jgi:hypothetical protein